MPSKKEPKREGGAAAEDVVEQEQEAPETGVEEAIAEESAEMVAEDAAAEEMPAEETVSEQMVAQEAEAEEEEAVEAVAEAEEAEAEAEPENEAVMPAAAATVKGPAAAPQKELPEYLRRRRSEVGRVVSDKMMKTVVVAVERSRPHPLYKKIVRKTAKFMAHDELGARTGDTVRIIESRPMSRHKRWQVVEIVQKAQQL
jgi:small subunit ribosomal protein S17